MSVGRISVSTDGTFERVQQALGAMPENVDRARYRAQKRLSQWVSREILRASARAIDTTQKALKSANRVHSRLIRDNFGISIWIGTNPLDAHKLGAVRWTRKMPGARVRQRSFPGAWSWKEGQARVTAGLVMHRTGEFGRNNNPKLERIDVETVEIDPEVRAAAEQLLPEIERRYEELLRTELQREIAREVRLGR